LLSIVKAGRAYDARATGLPVLTTWEYLVAMSQIDMHEGRIRAVAVVECDANMRKNAIIVSSANRLDATAFPLMKPRYRWCYNEYNCDDP